MDTVFKRGNMTLVQRLKKAQELIKEADNLLWEWGEVFPDELDKISNKLKQASRDLSHEIVIRKY